MKIKITSDSTCDLSCEQIAKYDVHILPLAVAMGENNYRDGVDITPEQIYAHVAKGGDLPKTAANNIADYAEAFAMYSKEYDAVIHLNISAEFSSCYQNARIAAEEFDNVHVVDSRNLSTGHGLLLLKGIELAQQGMAAADIAQVLRETADKVDASFILDQLEYLAKGGRCSSVVALGANLLKLKPCIDVKNGKMGVGKKYRGKFEKVLLQYVAERVGDGSDIRLDRVFVTHAGCDEAVYMSCVEKVKELAPFAEVHITRAGCTISSHCGQNTLGVLFIRKQPI